MNGRQEISMRIEEKIQMDLKDSPQILKDFYYSMTDKTPNTKKVYIRYVSDYLKWCDDYKIATKSTINMYKELLEDK